MAEASGNGDGTSSISNVPPSAIWGRANTDTDTGGPTSASPVVPARTTTNNRSPVFADVAGDLMSEPPSLQEYHMHTSLSRANPLHHLKKSLPSTIRLMKKLSHIMTVSSSAIFLLVVFPLLFNSAVRDAREGKTDFAAFYSAASFVVITLVLSFREILHHLYNWYAPEVQKFVVRILFMVPLYSVGSWLSLRFHVGARVYIDTIRDLYEAYVIQSFVYYLVELLGGEDRMAGLLSRKDPEFGDHGWLMSKLGMSRQWTMGREFLLKVKHGVLQYVVIRTTTTLLVTFVFLPSGNYGEGTFCWTTAYGYITVIINISVLYAVYVLVKLFYAVQSDLRSPIDWHPIGKFLCIKGVVFFTWWQSVFIYMLQSQGFIKDIGTWSGDDVANGIIDYLVCVEMVFFAIAHMFTFTYKEYLPEELEDQKQSGIVGWLFRGIDKRRRRLNHDGTHDSSPSLANAEDALQSALLQDDHGDDDIQPYIDEEGNVTENGASYKSPLSPQGFSKLNDPLSLREALVKTLRDSWWS
ncbi:hypothetical protein THAOC_11930 [Thalassiosira oceanica]|uniref:Uncharacterized protein n=1 Tax=Thalassiosira oceanica TaxID=159749 RepID=K0SNY8_THAOC|nr:hypothetical protein THAOC_11930 [Thalassiosira oceanica]|eukprot:EJK67080.1 hypothetical protein THAOC_11930 [Thalassiosira oceanica]